MAQYSMARPAPLVRVATRRPLLGQIVGWRRWDGQRILIRVVRTEPTMEHYFV